MMLKTEDKRLIRTYCDEAGGYVVPYMLRLRDIVIRPYLSNKSTVLSKSLTKVYVGGGGGLFYCTTKTASLMMEVYS